MGERFRRRPGPRDRGGRGRRRSLDAQGPPARADRAVSPLGELLGPGRRDGPVRPVLRAPLRPRRRARLRAGRLRAELRALRPVHRVLEPRLHGVRPRCRRLGDPAPEAEHRHGDGARALRDARPGGGLDLRHRRVPADHGLDRARVGRPLRRLARGDESTPRALRPRAGHDLPRRGGHHTLERGPWLCPPAADPALRRPGQADRPAGRPSPPAGRRRAGRAVVPGGRRERGRDRAGRSRRGGAVSRDARPRHARVRRAGDRATSGRRTRSGSQRRTASRSS